MEGYGYHKQDLVPKFWREKYEKDAQKYWDAFYKRHSTHFFKDRHWIQRELLKLQQTAKDEHSNAEPTDSHQIRAIEIGCGVGNTVFPLLQEIPNLFIYAVDFSATAIELVQKNPLYTQLNRCKAAVCDITKDSPDKILGIEPESLDMVFLIFCLSAISPDLYPAVISRLGRLLKPGGMILLRDYGLGDLAQERFAQDNAEKKLGENFYVRHDGTRAYYFSLDLMEQLMIDGGFQVIENDFVKRQIENKKLKLQMDRVWIQCCAKKR